VLLALTPELMINVEDIMGINVTPRFVLPQGQGVVAINNRVITET
jgi:hypothetical protein